MLDESLSATMNQLIQQNINDFHRENQKKKTNLLNEVGSGWVIPPGKYFGERFEQKKEAIRVLSEIVWKAASEALNAYKPEYYPEIAQDLKQELSRHLPERLSVPDNFTWSGWSIPDRNEEKERSNLEIVRGAALGKLHTQINLYAATLKQNVRNNMQEQPIINIIGNSNSPIAINSPNANQVHISIKEIQPIFNAIKEILNQETNLTEDERRTHLINVENFEKELINPIKDKNILRKSFDNFLSYTKDVGAIASSVQSLKGLIAPLLF